MAAVNSNVSDLNNEGEHIEDVIAYLKESSKVFGCVAAIATALKDQIKKENPEYNSRTYNLVDAIWRLAIDSENASGWQAEEIERKGIRQETNSNQVAKQTAGSKS